MAEFKPIALIELLRKENPTPGLVLATVRDYTQAGWCVNDIWLKDIMDKTEFFPSQLRQMESYLLNGQRNKSLRGDPIGVSHYDSAVKDVRDRMGQQNYRLDNPRSNQYVFKF